MNEYNKTIKTTSALLALLMLLAMIPFGSVNAKIIDSGKCGEKVTWQFDDQGTLTLSGEGGMYEYNSHEAPWYEDEDGYGGFEKSILKVVVTGSVTKVCEQAFIDCINLKSVIIGDSVGEIGNGAFLGCDKLDDITIPDKPLFLGGDLLLETAYLKNEANWQDGALYLGNHLLDVKEDLKGSFTVKAGTLSIAESAFRYCESLTGIDIPDSVKIIGEKAFYGCLQLVDIKLPDGIGTIPASAFSQCKSLKKIKIPYGTESIEGYAFFVCESLTTVAIPESVRRIDRDAFYNCKEMRSVTVPKSVTEIGQNAFGYYYVAGDAEKLAGFTIYCYKDSAAEKYAKVNGFNIIYMELTLLTGFKPGSTLEEFGKKYPTFGNVVFIDRKGDLITSGPLFTGLTVFPMKGLVNVEYRIVVTGDTDGNGKIDATDYIAVKRHILKSYELDGAYAAAADTDGNGKIDSTDYILIKSHILGIHEL